MRDEHSVPGPRPLWIAKRSWRKFECLQPGEKQTMSGMSQWWSLFQLPLQTPTLDFVVVRHGALFGLAAGQCHAG
jgi:hypothetical protein